MIALGIFISEFTWGQHLGLLLCNKFHTLDTKSGLYKKEKTDNLENSRLKKKQWHKQQFKPFRYTDTRNTLKKCPVNPLFCWSGEISRLKWCHLTLSQDYHMTFIACFKQVANESPEDLHYSARVKLNFVPVSSNYDEWKLCTWKNDILKLLRWAVSVCFVTSISFNILNITKLKNTNNIIQ